MSGPQCCENPPALNPNSGSGSVIELGGLKTYTCGPSDSKLAIVLFADIFGYEAPNLRNLADKVSAAGFYVVAPDLFYGDQYNPTNTKRPIPVWLTQHEPAKACEDSKHVIEALKSKGISAIGAAGFCYGAKMVVELAKCGLIQAGVFLHPSFVTVEDVEEVNVPLAILGAEIDKISPPELVKKFEDILSSKSEFPSFVKVVPGVAHGWTMRYKLDDEKAVKSAEEAHEVMLNWFIKHVK